MKLRILVPTLLLAFTFPAIAQDYKVTILPKLNGLNTNGFSMNASGQVVGAAPVPGGGWRNFLWSRQGGMADITVQTEFSIKSVNAGGFIAGTALVPAGYHAAVLSPGGALQDLGTLGGVASHATTINDQGQVAGCSETPNSKPVYEEAFVWSTSSGMQDLGPGTETLGCPTDTVIGNLGQVVGILPNNDVFLWTADQGVQDLGFPGVPTAINDANAMVGAGRFGGVANAFLWTPSGGEQELPPLPGYVYSYSASINNHGQVVGTLATQPGTIRSFIWTQATGMHLLPATNAGWQAVAINDAGQILLGRGGTATRLMTPLMKVTLTSSGNPSQAGQTVTFTAVVTSVQGAPPDGENIVIKDGTKILGSVTLSSGTASFSTSSLKAGTHTIVANYVGDVHYFSS